MVLNEIQEALARAEWSDIGVSVPCSFGSDSRIVRIVESEDDIHLCVDDFAVKLAGVDHRVFGNVETTDGACGLDAWYAASIDCGDVGCQKQLECLVCDS